MESFNKISSNEIDILGLNTGYSFSNLLKNRKLLKQNIPEYDIVHIQYGGYFGLFVLLFCNNKKTIISFCGSDVFGTYGGNYLKRKVYNFFLPIVNYFVQKTVSKIISKSKILENQILSKYKYKSLIIPNGVDINRFENIDRTCERNKFEWGDNDFVILFNLRRGEVIDTVKNFKLAKETIKELNKKNHNIIFHPFQNLSRDEVSKVLIAGDCLLLTSFHEGSPNIVKESLAANLPVVTVNCGDVLFLLDGVTNSHISKEYNAVELSNLLFGVIKEDSRTNGLSQIVKKGLNINQTNNKILKLYKELS